jgi:hypothetical protein
MFANTTAIHVHRDAARKLAAGAVLAAACAAPLLVGIAGQAGTNQGAITLAAPHSVTAIVRPADDIGWDGGHSGTVTNAKPIDDIGWDGTTPGSSHA